MPYLLFQDSKLTGVFIKRLHATQIFAAYCLRPANTPINKARQTILLAAGVVFPPHP